MSLNVDVQYTGLRRDPLSSLKTVSTLMALLQSAAIIMYATALMAVRFNDQDLDPWHAKEFYFFAASTTFIIPLLFTLNLWMNYRSSFAYTLQTIVCLVWIGWGAFHIVTLIIDWTNCNDMTGSVPDVPYCINRYFPSETIPDFSFYALFISLCVNVAVTVFWLWFGSRLKIATSGLVKRYNSRAISGDNDDFIGSTMSKSPNKNILMNYNKYVFAQIYDAIQSEMTSLNNNKQGKYIEPQSAAKFNCATAAFIGSAVLNSMKAGKGVIGFHQYLGSSAEGNYSEELEAFKNAILVSSHYNKQYTSP